MTDQSTSMSSTTRDHPPPLNTTPRTVDLSDSGDKRDYDEAQDMDNKRLERLRKKTRTSKTQLQKVPYVPEHRPPSDLTLTGRTFDPISEDIQEFIDDHEAYGSESEAETEPYYSDQDEGAAAASNSRKRTQPFAQTKSKKPRSKLWRLSLRL